jgi:hypothetical protein
MTPLRFYMPLSGIRRGTAFQNYVTACYADMQVVEVQ